MGRPLTPYACDNCIPGDAAAWRLPLLLVVLVCGALAAFAWARSNDVPGRRALALRLSGLLLLAGPPMGVFGVLGDIKHGRTYCDSALRASMLRGRPDDKALDPAQLGCKEKGERYVAIAYAWSGATFTAAAVLGVAGAVPVRRRPAVAA